jgi:hypothetical protein
MSTHEFSGKADVEISVGDEKQVDFFPRMKIKRWDNEVNFSVGIISTFQGSHGVVSDKVEWNDGHGIGAKFYEKPGDQFEFEIILDEKPAAGFVLLSIEHKGLRFLYQPELTKEEIDNGNIRPDNVVGSYAVYHESMKGNYVGGKNYRAGKVCHIYRPYVIDANRKQRWCDLDITGNVMKITIPDGLVYPVVVDPTFGVNPASPGASWELNAVDEMIGSLFTSPADIDTAQSISVYMKKFISPFNMKGLIVLHSNLNIITNGIGSASSAVSSDTGIWALSDFATDPSPAASTEYVLMCICSGSNYFAYETGSANQGHAEDLNDYTTPTNPTGAVHNNNEYSIYCTYTALHELVATIAATTATSASALDVLREFESAIAATTSISAADLKVLRELLTTISATTSTSASNMLMLRELAAILATNTSTSSSDVDVLRELDTSIATTTATNAIVLGVILELASTIAATTSTSAAEIAVLRELIATSSTTTATLANLKVLRELISTIPATTLTSSILLGLLFELASTIAVTTTTSTAEIDVLRELIATSDTTIATSAADMAVLRELATAISVQTAIEVALEVLRELASTIPATTALSDIELLIVWLRELTTTIAATTAMSAVDVAVLRNLAASMDTTTSLSSATLGILREFGSTVSAETSTSDVSMVILRSLTSQIATGTDVSTATILVLRELSATIPAETLLNAINLAVVFGRALRGTPTITARGNDPFIK